MAMTAWSAKIFEQSDLLISEWTDRCTPNRNHSNRCSLPQQRRAKDSPSAGALLKESRFWKLAVKFSGDVMDMVSCRPVHHRPSRRIATTEGWRGRKLAWVHILLNPTSAKYFRQSG